MISVTPSASKHICQMLHRRKKGLGIRVGVRTTGCSGLAYILEYVDQPLVGDLVNTFDGFSVYIDPKHAVYLQDLIVDYVRNGLNQGFEFQNKLEKDRCGCGESFRI